MRRDQTDGHRDEFQVEVMSSTRNLSEASWRLSHSSPGFHSSEVLGASRTEYPSSVSTKLRTTVLARRDVLTNRTLQAYPSLWIFMFNPISETERLQITKLQGTATEQDLRVELTTSGSEADLKL